MVRDITLLLLENSSGRMYRKLNNVYPLGLDWVEEELLLFILPPVLFKSLPMTTCFFNNKLVKLLLRRSQT